jgi:hypothetical protein
MLQCASTLRAGVGAPPGVGARPGVGAGVPVCAASISTLSGKAMARSM